MKVLIIGPFPPPITGNSLVNKLVFKHFPILYPIIKMDKINNSYPVLKEDLGRFSFKKLFFYFSQYLKILKVFNADKIYIAIGITFFGVLKYAPFIFFAKLLRKEVIIHIHSNHLWKEYETLKGIRKKMFYNVLAKADKGIVLSSSLRKNLTPFLNNDKIYELENFAEDFLFENSIDKNVKELRLAFLSNLMIEKGIVDLLEALLILQDQGVNFKAKIAGGIDTEMEKIILPYFDKLSENVEYLGVVHGDQKKNLLDWSNVFVFPTYYTMEGQPICIFEAMATSNIILTTKHAGIPDIFKEGVNGFYIDKKLPVSISNKLIELSNNMENMSSIFKNNFKESCEKYRLEIFIKKLFLILQK